MIVRRAMLAFASVLCGLGMAHSDEAKSPPLISPAPGSRYEIVQSGLAARMTFKLSLACGVVWQLVTGKSGEFYWQLVHFVDQPVCLTEGHHYQLSTSSVNERITLLMNTDSGMTWFLVGDPKGGYSWQKMTD